VNARLHRKNSVKYGDPNCSAKNPAFADRVFLGNIVSFGLDLSISVSAIHHVVHRHFIAATETLSIVGLGAVRHMGMTIFVAIVDVRSAVIVVVFPGAFDSIVKALALYVAELLWGSIPGAIMITILAIGGTCRREWLGDDITRCCKCHSED
jgi:hypothetical protein